MFNCSSLELVAHVEQVEMPEKGLWEVLWGGRVLAFAGAEGLLTFLDVGSGSTLECFDLGDEGLNTFAISSKEKQYGKGLVVTRTREEVDGVMDYFLKFYSVDLLSKSLEPFQRLRYSEEREKFAVSASMNHVIYFLNSNLVLADINQKTELKVTVVLEDIEKVVKIRSYGSDDFVILYKRKAKKKEVAYLLTHTGVELTADTEAEKIKVSDLRF